MSAMSLETVFIYGVGAEIALDELTDVSFQEVLSYWEDLKGSRFAPAWEDFNLTQLRADTLACATMVEAIGGSAQPDFIYRYYGSGHTAAKRIDRLGEKVRVHPHGRGQKVHAEYAQVYREARPIAYRRDLIINGETTVPQEVLRLPLSSDGSTVDGVFCVCDWWSMRGHWQGMRPISK